MVLPAGCPCRVGVIVENHWTKGQFDKVPTVPQGWWGGGIVANDLCIMAIKVSFHLLPL